MRYTIHIAMAKDKAIYLEETVQVNFRVPKSKRKEFRDEANLILKKYDARELMKNVGYAEVKDGECFEIPKKIEPSADDDKTVARVEGFPESEAEQINSEIKRITEEKEKEMSETDIKKAKINALQGIADTIKSGGALENSTEKKTIFDKYDCEVVRNVDLDDLFQVNSKTNYMGNKYDQTITYVRHDGQMLLFRDKSESDRFVKEYGVK